ncbi:hypothetical protein M408DRAFT_122141 [Serendipita vermifera MAFF 305830]|uniref:Uncharacterized protein n=1 Tax=Serendipita vermifera MAFF 305830 TaxID=933852 RepID=A0A0C2WT39_SERVB|nr:hypothetical protein M408DRAFT_122141 [Serendipita vermifera MAFF 305830]
MHLRCFNRFHGDRYTRSQPHHPQPACVLEPQHNVSPSPAIYFTVYLMYTRVYFIVTSTNPVVTNSGVGGIQSNVPTCVSVTVYFSVSAV